MRNVITNDVVNLEMEEYMKDVLQNSFIVVTFMDLSEDSFSEISRFMFSFLERH